MIQESFPELKELVLLIMIAPSGRPHIGTLRGMIHLDTWSHELRQAGYKCEKVLVVYDNHVLTETEDPSLSKFLNRRFSEIPCPKGCCSSYAEHYRDEILLMLQHFQIDFSKILLGSEIESRLTFKTKILESLKQERIINSILATYQESPFQFFYPRCDNCGKLYGPQVTSMDAESGDLDYRCDFCGYVGKTNVMKNGGKLKFKLETALIWKELGANIDFEGIDEERALDCSREIFETLYDSSSPIHFMFNLVLTGNNKRMSKSKGRGFPAVLWKSIAQPVALRYYLVKEGNVPMLYFSTSEILKIIKQFDAQESLFYKNHLTKENSKPFELSYASRNLPRKRICKIPYETSVRIARSSSDNAEQKREAHRIFVRAFRRPPLPEEEEKINERLKHATRFLEIMREAENYGLIRRHSEELRIDDC